jgi:hypothetical protein
MVCVKAIRKTFLSLKISYPLLSMFLNQGKGYYLTSQQLYGNLLVSDPYSAITAKAVR